MALAVSRIVSATLVLVALLAVGCSYEVPTLALESSISLTQGQPDATKAHWTLDETFSADELGALVAAADAWSEATGGRVALTFEIGPTTPGAPWTISQDPALADSELEGFASADAVTVEPGLSTKCLRLTAAHEFGHTFGIGHGGTLMQPSASYACTVELTQADVALFDAVQR